MRGDGDVLAAYEREAHRPIVVRGRRGQRAADAARVARFIDEAVPIFAGGPEPCRKEAARPVRGRAHLHIAARNDARKCFVARDLRHQPVRARARIRLAPRPQNHALRRGIPGCDALRVKIAPLRARHSIEATFGATLPIEQRHALKARFPDAEHPVVRTHPETGEKALFVNAFTTHIVNFHTPANVRHGQDYAPGAAHLLEYLAGRVNIPDYQVRWRWQKNSVAIWDNRCTQHYAVQDYWPAVRRMERAGIVGDVPV